jgi:hypothetical protein
MAELEQHLTEEEAMQLIELKNQVLSGNKNAIRQLRRRVRNNIFRIVQGTEQHPAIEKVMLGQLQGNMKLNRFTFDWDVAPLDPLKVVLIHDWAAEGGKYENIMEPGSDGIPRSKRICFPTAFTNQE